MLLIACLSIPLSAKAASYIAESPRGQSASYNEADNTVTVTATAPTYTEYDWETWVQLELPYISYVSIERRLPGTEWPTEEHGRVESPAPGAQFEFIDKEVMPDKKYEYRLTCYVDAERGSSSYVSAYTGITPGQVSAFTATTADHLSNAVDISVTAPTHSKSGQPLTTAMTIDIQLQDGWSYNTIHSIENAEPGKTYNWKHSDLAMNKAYYYRAAARIGSEGVGDSMDATVYVGLDKPGVPENFVAKADNESVILTWNQPTTGNQGGNYDPASTTYSITRIYLDGKEELANDNIAGTEYVDNPGFEEEKTVKYRIIAKNATGESVKEAMAGPVVVGKPSKLPFSESFENALLSHQGWTTLTSQDDPYYTYEAWEFVKSGSMFYLPTDEFLTITPQDKDNGLASCKFIYDSKDGQTESLVSPHITVTDIAEINVTFNFWEVCKDASANIVRLFVSRNDGEWEEIYTSEPPVDTKPQWREVSVPVSLEKKSDNVRIRIDAVRHDGPTANVYVDNFSVVEKKDSSVGKIEAADDAEKEYFTIQGLRIERPETPGIYIVRQGNRTTKEIIR